MSSNMTKEALVKKKFSIISQHYELLGNRLKKKLIELLEKNHIPYISVKFRVKSFDSFYHKIKKYNDDIDPFKRIDDICGLRIICYYYSDLFRINQLIQDEFGEQIQEFDTKIPSSELEIVKFGYRSWHYLLKLEEEWIKDIGCEAYSNFRAEIQVCTSIMDAWGTIEHELSYKKDIPISDNMKRRFARISALLEMVDEQFDKLREEKRQYLDSRTFKSRDGFEKLELTFENFQKMLNAYFPYRVSSLNQSKRLYHDISQVEVDMKDLVNCIEKAKDILPVIEEDIRKLFLAQNKLTADDKKLLKMAPYKQNQVGALRNILWIFHDGFWKSQRIKLDHHDWYVFLIIKWRKKLRG